MNFWMGVATGALCFFSCASAAIAEEILLLRLRHTTDGTLSRDIQLLEKKVPAGDREARRPGRQFVFRVNDDVVTVPQRVLARVEFLRQGFSNYDRSGGIQYVEDDRESCEPGPAAGMTLEVRYLAYGDRYRQTPTMQPVLSVGYSCPFRGRYVPVDRDAQAQARAAMEMLEAIDSLYGEGYIDGCRQSEGSE